MQISKTKLKFNSKRKTNPIVDEALKLALKNKAWLPIAKIIAGPRRRYSKVNLSLIDSKTTAGDTVVVVGKVLASGDVTKKLRICSLAFSSSAVEKLKKSKSEIVSLSEEIKKNPKAEGLKLIN